MTHSVFISSTVRDLSHLRDTKRDVVVDLGYNPIMSDHGEVGYLPDHMAEDSCCVAMSESQLAILIVGKRYSSLSATKRQKRFETTMRTSWGTCLLIENEKQCMEISLQQSFSLRIDQVPSGTNRQIAEQLNRASITIYVDGAQKRGVR